MAWEDTTECSPALGYGSFRGSASDKWTSLGSHSNISQGKTSCENTWFFWHVAWELLLARTDEAPLPHHAALQCSSYTVQMSEVKLRILGIKRLSLISWVLNIWIEKSPFVLFKWRRDLGAPTSHFHWTHRVLPNVPAKTGGKGVSIKLTYFNNLQWLILLDPLLSLFATTVLSIFSLGAFLHYLMQVK